MPDLTTILSAKTPLTLAGVPTGFEPWLLADLSRAAKARAVFVAPDEAAMRTLDARFEIAIDDLDEALDEINTLIDVQSALQEVSNGYLFLPWNGHLSEP